ncbi:MAG TPA: hypothetical protein VIG77_00485 [Ktedonobacterales bacterium]|jgi:aminoglycoside phosphotransferase (APT) family kinase protein
MFSGSDSKMHDDEVATSVALVRQLLAAQFPQWADLPTLRAIVRERRLDPARISARWTARERVISLIVDQVKARANHGQAFRRV